jgi:hypothetical protein
MKKVFVAQHPTEAHLVKGLLESRDIPALVRGESLFGTRGETPVTADSLPSVWVTDDTQAEEALAILKAHRTGVDDVVEAGRPWTCPACGEAVESQFSACWKCGADRPDPSVAPSDPSATEA